jgi:hypothetical protein
MFFVVKVTFDRRADAERALEFDGKKMKGDPIQVALHERTNRSSDSYQPRKRDEDRGFDRRDNRNRDSRQRYDRDRNSNSQRDNRESRFSSKDNDSKRGKRDDVTFTVSIGSSPPSFNSRRKLVKHLQLVI